MCALARGRFIMSIASIMFKLMAGMADAKRDKGLTTPPDITRFDNIIYGKDRKWNKLDVYLPEGTTEKLPVIVSIHGGGFVYGDKELYQYYCMDLACRGFAVVNFTYHLAPKYKFPTPLLDTNAVLKWMVAHEDTYFLDMNNVMIVGDSAGAHLTSQYAAVVTNPEYAAQFGIKPPSFRLAAIGLNCGMYDASKFIPDDRSKMGLMEDYYTKDIERWGTKIDVPSHITENYPPAYLISAPGDFLLEHCEPMADFLKEKGIPCDYMIYGDEKTGHVFHLNIRSNLARQATDDEIAFMIRFLE